jgi:Rieske 2Fe-2S family protein
LDIDRLVAAQRPGYTLERVFYTDPAIFELEAQRMFFKSWQFVGHVGRIPKVGDYFLFTIAGESIIVLRASETEVTAMFNVCRHRGSHVCLDESGHVKKLICPYHAWVYDTDGSLLMAKHMQADFDPSCHGLKRCAVRIVEGMIFVCLSEVDAPDFDAIEKDLSFLFKPHGFASARVADRAVFRVKCNWKLATENAWECYHCPKSHQSYCATMPMATAYESARRQAEREAAQARWEAHARSLGHFVLPRERPAWREPYTHVARVPIQDGYLTQSQDGQPVAPLMGDFKQYDGGLTAFQTYPILWFAASNDHALLTRFTPLSVMETEAEYTWLVNGSAVEGVDYDVNRVTWLWRITGEEDKVICENNQKGVNSRTFEPGPYSTAEDGVDGFIRWYLRQMSSA